MISEGETITYAQATNAQRGRWPTCLKCRGPVDSIQVEDQVGTHFYLVTLACHGDTDFAMLDQRLVVEMPAGHNPIALVEKWNYGYAFTEFACRIVFVRTREDTPELSKAHAILLRTCVERAIDIVHTTGTRGHVGGAWRRLWDERVDGEEIVSVANQHLADVDLGLEVSNIRFRFPDPTPDAPTRRYLEIDGIEVRPSVPPMRSLLEQRTREAERALTASIDRQIESMFPTGVTTPIVVGPGKGRESLSEEGKRYFDDLVEKYSPANRLENARRPSSDAIKYGIEATKNLERMGLLYDVPRRSGKVAAMEATRARIEAEYREEQRRKADELRAKSERAWSIIGAILIVVSRAWASKPDLDDADKRFALLEFT